MLHHFDGRFKCCQWCGLEMGVIKDSGLQECSGIEGINHLDYLRKKKKFDKFMDNLWRTLNE